MDIGDGVQERTSAVTEQVPWQVAARALDRENGVVLSGPWSFRKVLLQDGMPGEALRRVLDALIETGEEFAVSVYRPRSEQWGPADYRVALVTWGNLLDLVAEEIPDRLKVEYER
jgi:hypothetical protein